MRSFFHIKDIDINCSDENTCSDTNIKFGKLTANDFTNTSLTQDISSKIQELFTGKNIDEQLDIP
ncbi:MAG: hypothetical protein LBP53_08540 [Candidatus Peribacteria bacterium]|jgi:hypothetical protein|nr:hypothetical protein [Candidatus Peribacteria bacterium]